MYLIFYWRTLILSFADEVRSQSALLHHSASPTRKAVTNSVELMSYEELPVLDLAAVKAATDNFSDSNKLGQGSFGSVYKVLLSIFLPLIHCA